MSGRGVGVGVWVEVGVDVGVFVVVGVGVIVGPSNCPGPHADARRARMEASKSEKYRRFMYSPRS